MIKKIKAALTGLTLASLFFVPLLAPVAVSAQPNPQAAVCSGAANLQFDDSAPADCSNTEDAKETVNGLVTTIINIFSVIVGIVAVIMIVFGGFKYITSGGDSGNIQTAKNTILFAIVGLIIVAMAQIIVKFVLAKATITT